MIRWSDTQSVFQLLTAINIAYFALREIRTPAFLSYSVRLEAIINACDSLTTLVERSTNRKIQDRRASLKSRLSLEKVTLVGYRNPYASDLEQKERFASYLAFVAACGSFGCLFYGALHANFLLSARALWLSTGIFLLPTIFFIVYNLMIIQMIKEDSEEITKISKRISSIKMELAPFLMTDMVLDREGSTY
jgi:hypothetical protein